MIRLARSTDKGRVVELLRGAHVEAGFDRSDGPTGFCFPFEPEYGERLFLGHLLAARGCSIVLEKEGTAQGILMAAAFEHPFGRVWMAKETVWWIDPRYRGSSAFRMLDAYEKWAKDQNCKFAGMAGMGGDPQVAVLYQRRGYKRAETHFLRSL